MNANIKPAPPAAAGRVVELRALLRARFPEAHAEVPVPAPASVPRVGSGTGPGFVTGVPCLDEFGVWPGALAELVGRRGAAGLAVSAALAEAARRERVIALVDAGDVFDPQDAGAERCRKLLWVRCRSLAEAVKAADLLARDGNVPLVLLDLAGQRAAGLRRLPGSTWFRLRGVAKKAGVVLLAITPEPSLGCADLRVAAEGGSGAAARSGVGVFERLRDDLESGLAGAVTRGRGRGEAGEGAGTGEAAAVTA